MTLITSNLNALHMDAGLEVGLTITITKPTRPLNANSSIERRVSEQNYSCGERQGEWNPLKAANDQLSFLFAAAPVLCGRLLQLPFHLAMENLATKSSSPPAPVTQGGKVKNHLEIFMHETLRAKLADGQDRKFFWGEIFLETVDLFIFFLSVNVYF